nr:hypothetical protein Iba_chr15fCG0630 [Ipomoea batatas]
MHCVPNSRLRRQMHHVGERHGVEELLQQNGVVYIAFYDNPAAPVTKTENPDFDLGNADARTLRSQFGPSWSVTDRACLSIKFLRLLAPEAGGEKKKKRRITKTKTKDQSINRRNSLG